MVGVARRLVTVAKRRAIVDRSKTLNAKGYEAHANLGAAAVAAVTTQAILTVMNAGHARPDGSFIDRRLHRPTAAGAAAPSAHAAGRV